MGDASGLYCNVGVASGTISNIKSYNQSTGILNFYVSATATGGVFKGSNCSWVLSYTARANASVHAYLIY